MTNEKQKVEARKVGSIYVVEHSKGPFGDFTYRFQGFEKRPKSDRKLCDFFIETYPSPLILEPTTNDWNRKHSIDMGVWPGDPTYDVLVGTAKNAGEGVFRRYYYLNGKFVADRFCYRTDFLSRPWCQNGQNRPPKKIIRKYEPLIKLLEEKVGRTLVERD